MVMARVISVTSGFVGFPDVGFELREEPLEIVVGPFA
jgi:hypothetical protein